MGLLESIFGGSTGLNKDAKSLLGDERNQSAMDKKKLEDLKKKQLEDREALKAKGAGLQGGGRTGLMYGQNQQGVI